MSFVAANPAGFSHLSPCLVERANKSLPRCNGGGGLRPNCGGHADSSRAAIVANVRGQCTDENFALGRACRYVSRLCSGTASGLFMRPAAARSSASAAPPLRVTVSLKILFGKNAEKISPEPPQMQSFGTWEHGLLA